MFSVMVPLGVGFAGLALALGLLAAILALVYPVMWVWMLIDGVLRTDAEYPGTGANRKILWVLAMALVHPVFIVYFFAVFLKAPRARHAAPVQYTPTTAPPVPQAQPSTQG
jgi:hypothetical protein